MGKITGYEKPEKQGKPRSDPFDELHPHLARPRRYQGPEALGQEGPNDLICLPTIILAS